MSTDDRARTTSYAAFATFTEIWGMSHSDSSHSLTAESDLPLYKWSPVIVAGFSLYLRTIGRPGFMLYRGTSGVRIIYWRNAVLNILVSMLKQFTKWCPDCLCKAMPYIYSVAGLTVILYPGTPAGYGTGTLLLIAALWIWMMRSAKRAFMNRIE